MPGIIALFWTALLQIVGSLVGRVVVALGFGYVEYKGISTLIDSVKSDASSLLGSVGGSVLANWAGFFRIDVHVSIIISAIGVKVLLNALGGSSVKRIVQK